MFSILTWICFNTVFVDKESFSWWVPSGWEVVVVLVVLAIWLYSLRRLHTVWERTLNYTQVHSWSGITKTFSIRGTKSDNDPS